MNNKTFTSTDNIDMHYEYTYGLDWIHVVFFYTVKDPDKYWQRFKEKLTGNVILRKFKIKGDIE